MKKMIYAVSLAIVVNTIPAFAEFGNLSVQAISYEYKTEVNEPAFGDKPAVRYQKPKLLVDGKWVRLISPIAIPMLGKASGVGFCNLMGRSLIVYSLDVEDGTQESVALNLDGTVENVLMSDEFVETIFCR